MPSPMPSWVLALRGLRGLMVQARTTGQNHAGTHEKTHTKRKKRGKTQNTLKEKPYKINTLKKKEDMRNKANGKVLKKSY